jgi:uncharacterized membrane protein HdeD (DUF308 family)
MPAASERQFYYLVNEKAMKTRVSIIGWGLVLLGLVEITYVFYQRRSTGDNINPLHLIIILVTLTAAAVILLSRKKH